MEESSEEEVRRVSCLHDGGAIVRDSLPPVLVDHQQIPAIGAEG